jgi:hypothetical protein
MVRWAPSVQAAVTARPEVRVALVVHPVVVTVAPPAVATVALVVRVVRPAVAMVAHRAAATAVPVDSAALVVPVVRWASAVRR